MKEKHSIGSSCGQIDWRHLDRLTDDEIAATVANDPDAAPLDLDWSEAVLVIPPDKKAISIRVNQDMQNGLVTKRHRNARRPTEESVRAHSHVRMGREETN